MSAWASQPSIPSGEDISLIKGEIRTLERELVSALERQVEHEVTDLIQQLESRKAQIAPIRKAPFDVLSLIFEFCGEIEWTAPLRIGGVSRYWRTVVLQTPRSWCYLDLRKYNKELSAAYITRSGKCALHLSLAEPSDVYLVAELADRIKCLVIAALMLPGTDHPCFPALQHLHFPFEFDWIVDLSSITMSSFPTLRHLELHNSRYDTPDCSSLPPLQTLILTAWDEEGWPDLIFGCKNTLMALEITIYGSHVVLDDYHVDLPLLRHLKVLNRETPEAYLWELGFSTPSLQTYIEGHEHKPYKLMPGQHLHSVTHMRTQRLPSLEAGWPHLHVLQLDLTFDELSSFLEDLEKNPLSCPRLESLEFGDSYIYSSEMEDAKRTLNGWNNQILPELEGTPPITSSWSMQLPGEDETAVRNQMNDDTITEASGHSAEWVYRARLGHTISRFSQNPQLGYLNLCTSLDLIELILSYHEFH